MSDLSAMFHNIPMDSVFSDESQILADSCAYLVPKPVKDEKIAFFGLLNLSSSFLEAGTGHFNPAYKTDKNDGMIHVRSHF